MYFRPRSITLMNCPHRILQAYIITSKLLQRKAAETTKLLRFSISTFMNKL